jgi:cbb3-type cytochrome oxidase subunit 1
MFPMYVLRAIGRGDVPGTGALVMAYNVYMTIRG